MLRGFIISCLFIIPAVSFGSAPLYCLKEIKQSTIYLSKKLSTEQAVKLCSGSNGASVTVYCFEEAISDLKFSVEMAIELCASK